MKVQKGDYGYLKNRKTRALIGIAAMIAAGLAVFIAGLFLNKMSHRNIFTIIAVLFVLPGAKFLVRFIVTFPYHPVDRQLYEQAKKHTDAKKMQLYTDMVITSSEKVMYLKFAAVGSKHVIALTGNEKQETAYIRKYLNDGVNNWGSNYKVKVLETEKSFFKEIDSISVQDASKEEEKNVQSYLISLIV
ncbi:MAG TPA: hypothetical protein DCZ23_03290 [Lachnospiraceae bacterium]|nr:hypothetical protein [Lachnospiraceae bacterium]